MSREPGIEKSARGWLCLLAIGLAIGVAGCSGGGGSHVVLQGLVAVSFSQFPVQAVGPQGELLPVAFRDEVIEFTFSGPLDTGLFGGFKSDAAGVPRVFLGMSPSSGGAVPYLAFEDQALAADSLLILRNVAGGPAVPSYVVGRHLSKLATIVVDPRVDVVNTLGVLGNVGYAPGEMHTFQIPAGSDITIGGVPVRAAGSGAASLPLAPGAVTAPGGVELVFFSEAGLSPDPIPPQIVEIRSVSGSAGVAGDPIAVDDGIEVVFSKPIDVASIDPLANLMIRNNDILTGGATGDPTHVPGLFNFQQVDFQTLVTFSPTPGYGPGLGSPPVQGYGISVRVGTFGSASAPPLLGQPQGNPLAQVSVSNSIERVFLTQAAPGAPGSATIVETFQSQAQQSTTFAAPFSSASWGQVVVDPCSGAAPPGLGPHTGVGLQASHLCGDPLATTGLGGDPALLGTRKQFNLTQTVSPTLFPPAMVGLLAPFDDALANLGPTLNPQGGSHLIQLFEDTDVGNSVSEPLHDSLELVEWGPTSSTVFASCYPSYQAWCGITSNCAPADALGGPCQGLSQSYTANFDLATAQAPDPAGLGGVLVSGLGAYVVPSQLATYMAFPVFNPVFDYDPNAGGPRHFLIEQNIEPGSGGAVPASPPNPPGCTAAFNINRFASGGNFPLRRAFGPPLSIQLAQVANPTLISASFGGWDRYDWRFTWVNAVSSARSKFYSHAGVPNPDYQGVAIIPSPLLQPPGTEATWEFQGTDALTPFGDPFGNTSPWVTYWDGASADPTNVMGPTGQFFPGALDALDGFQFVRFRVTMRANHLAPDGAGGFGTFQAYSGLVINLAY